ncbi:hydrogenase maturation protease [Magnetovibrio blakemorei]|nr:hydrogenase maturation protease [Magnetovibrio blakemorei]
MTEIPTQPSPWIIGVGNPMRGDDGVGAAVAAQLRADNIEAFDFDGDGAELMEMWAHQGQVILIDAAVSGAPLGTVHRFDANSDVLPRNFFRHSSHQFGVAEAVEMARVLDRLPRNLIIYAIEGHNFNLGAPLSKDVELAVLDTVDRIKADIAP